MENDQLRNTDTFVDNLPTRQGRVTFTKTNNVLICNAEGPFNEELIEALAAVEFGLTFELTTMGKWADIVVFKGSAFASPGTVDIFKYYLGVLVAQGVASVATALVYSPGTDASEMMQSQIVAAYESNGLKANVFDNIDSAMEWVLMQLDE